MTSRHSPNSLIPVTPVGAAAWSERNDRSAVDTIASLLLALGLVVAAVVILKAIIDALAQIAVLGLLGLILIAATR